MSDTSEETARKRQLFKELIQLEQEAGLYDEVLTPEEAVAITKQVRKERYENMKNEEFIDGMSEVHEVVYITLDRLQQSINDMMGVYMDMPEDITRQNPEVRELSAMHAVLTQFREMFIDNYDEAMRNYHSSKSWREDLEHLKSEWPEL